MLRRSRTLALSAGAVLALSVGTFAAAPGARAEPEATAEARLAWAKRHVELVCRPLEARQMFDRATRCYNDVARLVGDATKALPSASASKPAPAASVAAPAASSPAPATTAARPAAPSVTRPAATRPVVKTAARATPARPAPVRTRIVARQVTPPASEVGPSLRPAPTASRRCSGVGCLQYTLLGVGF